MRIIAKNEARDQQTTIYNLIKDRIKYTVQGKLTAQSLQNINPRRPHFKNVCKANPLPLGHDIMLNM